MPNWCTTDYHIHGSKKSIDKLTKLLKETWKTEKQWVGYVVEKLTGEECNIYARGFMLDSPNRVNNEQVDIYLDTAWGELYEWRHFIEDKFKDVHIGYLAIEPGNCVYASNMDEYANKYYIDDMEHGESEYYDEKGTIDYINTMFDKQFKSIDEVLDFCGSDSDVYINQIEEVA